MVSRYQLFLFTSWNHLSVLFIVKCVLPVSYLTPRGKGSNTTIAHIAVAHCNLSKAPTSGEDTVGLMGRVRKRVLSEQGEFVLHLAQPSTK